MKLYFLSQVHLNSLLIVCHRISSYSIERDKFVRLDREEGNPFYGDSDNVKEMDRLLLELTKQEIEKDELQRRIGYRTKNN